MCGKDVENGISSVLALLTTQLRGLFNRRPDAPLDFPPPDGVVVENPPLTRLLGHVATRGRRHSKERQKA